MCDTCMIDAQPIQSLHSLKYFLLTDKVHHLKVDASLKYHCFSNDTHISVCVWTKDFKINLCPSKKKEEFGKWIRPSYFLLFTSSLIVDLSAHIIVLVSISSCESVFLSYVKLRFLHLIIGVKILPVFLYSGICNC